MIAAIIRKGALVRLITFSIIMIGGFVYFSIMPREANPDVKVPVVMVTTVYVGVSPYDVEQLITIPLETELASLSDMKKLGSTSVEGASIISIEFEPSVVIEDALQQVRDRVSKAKRKLPSDAEETEIREISFSDMPIVIVSMAGGVNEQALKALGEDAVDRFTKVDGVLDAVLTGGREKTIWVNVDLEKLTVLGLSLNDVIGALQQENVNMPGGTVTSGDTSMLIRIPGDFEAARDLADVAIKRVGGKPIFMRDVAQIEDGYEKRQTYSRLNQESAVSISVKKRSGANILSVVDGVKQEMAQMQASDNWPDGVRVEYLGDQSKMIDDMVLDLENGILTALILVVFVLFLAMGLRNSLFVAAAIPLSMLLGIMILFALGFTLNMMVLFSLILVLGMLVDNGIVIIENIYRHLEMGKTLFKASVDGTSEVGAAVAMSTATTVAAFFPLVFWDGIMGQFMGYLPKTVIVVLLASLFTAIVLLPVFTAALMKLKGGSIKSIQADRETDDDPISGHTMNRLEDVAEGTNLGDIPTTGIMGTYARFLSWSIDKRYLVFGIAFASLFGTFMAYGALNHGVEFFPESEPNRATVSVRAPDGTDIEATNRAVREVEDILKQEENVKIYVADVGVSGGGNDPMSGAQATPHMGRITVDFLPDANTAKDGEKIRVENTSETILRLRERFQELVGVEVTISKEEMGPPVGADIAVEVSGDDFNEVGEAALRLRKQLLNLEGIAELTDNYRVGRPEMRLSIDRGAAKRIGASTGAIASTVRTAINGNTATTIRDGEEEYDVIVRVDPKQTSDLQSVMALRVPGRIDTSPNTFHVPISSVAKYELRGGSGAIRHIDQDLVVTVSGNVVEGVNPNEVRLRVADFLANYDALPDGITARMGGAQDEQEAAATFMSRAFVICIILILGVLVAQFNRFDIPLIILFSILLSLIGVLWGLVLTGKPFGIIMTGLGVISLAGVVVNNAIVLLDYVERLRANGHAMKDSLIDAGVTRFRPVVLTAATTVLGLIPMAVGFSIDFRTLTIATGSQTQAWWSGMAIAVIFGLFVATILTLVMVPTMYSILEDFGGLGRKLFKRKK